MDLQREKEREKEKLILKENGKTLNSNILNNKGYIDKEKDKINNKLDRNIYHKIELSFNNIIGSILKYYIILNLILLNLSQEINDSYIIIKIKKNGTNYILNSNFISLPDEIYINK